MTLIVRAGKISSTMSTIFNFDFPASTAGQTCTLIFLLPNQGQLETSWFEISGSGQVDFCLLEGLASTATSASIVPATKQDYGIQTLSRGNSYTIASFPCPASQSMAFQMKGVGDTSLEFFQDYNPSPIGMYVRTC